MTKVKGTKISSKIFFIEETYGKEMVGKVLQFLEKSEQETLKRILDTNWYPIELYDRLVTAIYQVAAQGDESIFETIGYYSAERALNNAYKGFFRSKDVLKLLSNMALMHSMMNDPGEMAIQNSTINGCSIIVSKPSSSVINCKVARAFYQKAIELCGVSFVFVKEVKCSGRGNEYCQFDISWQL